MQNLAYNSDADEADFILTQNQILDRILKKTQFLQNVHNLQFSVSDKCNYHLLILGEISSPQVEGCSLSAYCANLTFSTTL